MKSRIPWKLSLRTRLIVGVALLFAVLIGVFIADLVQRQESFLHQEQRDEALRLSKAVAQAGTPALLAGDVAGMQEVLSTVVGSRQLTYAFVVDDDGKVLASIERGLVGQYVSDPVSLRLRKAAPAAQVLIDTADLIDAAAPAVVGGRTIGWVRIGLGQELAKAAVAKLIQNGLTYALIAIVLGGAFAAWVGHWLTRALYGLLEVVKATRDGERDRRATVVGDDEVGVLANAFNGMLDRLGESESELRRLNEELEQRVEARTADLRTANEEVKKSEALFRGLLESSADAILLVKEDGTIILANPECSRVFGYEDQELIGRSVEILVPSRFTDHAGQREDYRHSPDIRPKGVGRQVLGRRKNGEEFPAEIRLSPLETEDGLIVSAIVRDVTERQIAEDRLRASEQRYRLLLENLPQRVFSKDRDSVYQAVNPAFAEVMGRAVDEIIGKTDCDIQGAERAKYIQELDRRVMSSGEPFQFDEEIVTNGETRTYHTLKAPVRDDDDRIVGLLGISWDITDRKRAENALAEATRFAEAASRAKSDFLANMSHEIRTPMNAIIGLSHLLGQTRLEARQRDYLDKIGSSANALLALLNDILDLSKVEAGKLELESREFRLDRQMRDLATILSATAQAKDIEVLFNIDPQVPAELIGDSLRLNQILINLAGNAIKFTEKGEVVVSVVPMELTEERAVLRFSIRDTGIGISPEQRQRLFQAFNQGDSSTSRRFGGTGLGLAISSRLVRLMGGAIEVDSEPGRGSEFQFTARFGRPLKSLEKPAARAGVPANLKVLVVDDNPTARDVMGNLISTFNWEADIVASGEEALALLEGADKRYDIVLLDWKMPGMDGLETSRRIRQTATEGPPPVIIVVTAYGREMVGQAPDAGLNAMLVKPVTASMLFDAVSDVFSGVSPPPQPATSGAALPLLGLRLLVAEDNLINQQVVSEMLAQAGATVVLAGNGALALRTFTDDAAYDAVLMDIQMPEMDGYMATAALRALPAGRDVPIIAMTANAMPSDRQRCLDAGMNDHVAKPLAPDVLIRTLCQWTGRQAENAGATPSLPGATAIPRIEGIDAATTLWRLGGDEKLFRRLLASFAQQLPSYVDRCAEAAASLDAKGLEAAVHAINGMAANAGASALAAAAGKLESAVRAGAPAGEWPGPLEDVRQLAARVLAGIAAAEAGWAGPRSAAGEVNRGALKTAVDALEGLLADDNFAAIEAFDHLRDDLTAVLGAPAVAPLAAAIGAFDFAAAKGALAEIVRRLASA